MAHQPGLISRRVGGFFYQIPAASYSTLGAYAMDYAFGVGNTSNTTLYYSNQLITAEPFGGVLCLGAYVQRNSVGSLTAPWLIKAQALPITAGCLGLVVSPHNWNPTTAEYTANQILLLDANMRVHVIQYDVRSSFFSGYNPPASSSAYPMIPSSGLDLSAYGATIAGMWIAQNDGGSAPACTHDAAISIPSVDAEDAPGTLVILNRGATAPVVVPNCGGGPICHIPRGVARWLFRSSSASDQHGWYVVTPGSPQWTIEAVNIRGVRLSTPIYRYAQGARANGTPLSHPGTYDPVSAPARKKGHLWVPYVQGTNYLLDLVEGDGTATGTTAVQHVVPLTNFSGLPPLPKTQGQQYPVPWKVTAILQDQKTNYKADHAGYVQGF